jgi:hypothetical protein
MPMEIRELVEALCSNGDGDLRGCQEERYKHQILLDDLLSRANEDGLSATLGNEQEVWDKMLAYILERRYGWSEGTGRVHMTFSCMPCM